MSQPVKSESKQVNNLLSQRALTNLDMLPQNDQSQKYNNNNNINNLITKTNELGALNHQDSTSNVKVGKIGSNIIKEELNYIGKHLKKPSSSNTPKIDNKEMNNHSISMPNNHQGGYLEGNNLLTLSSQLMSSRKCVIVYIFLIFMSLFTFIYSIVDIFYSLNKIPLIVCEAILCLVMTGDIIIRIFLLGCSNFVRKPLNWFDLIMIIFGIASLAIYICLEGDLSIKLESISFLIIIILRNVFMLFRIGILIKNEKEHKKRKNIEEIIAFDVANNDDMSERVTKNGPNSAQKPRTKPLGKRTNGKVYHYINEEHIIQEKKNCHTHENTMSEQL